MDAWRTGVLIVGLLLLAGCSGPAAVHDAPLGSHTSSTSTQPSSSTSKSSTSTARPAPQATITADWTPVAPAPGEEVRFTAKVDGLGSRTVEGYGWDFGDDASASVREPTHTYAGAGERTVSARALLSDGSIVLTSRVIVVGNATDRFAAGNVTLAGPVPTLPGSEGCGTHQSNNPRPDAWYTLGKPATYYDDACFHQYMVNDPDTATLDVLIIPPAGATALRDANLLRASVKMWESGIKAGARTHGLDWLADGLSLTPFVLGEDIPAGPSALVPDIVVVLGDQGPLGVAYAYAGIGSDAPLTYCHPVQAAGDGTLASPESLHGLDGFDRHHGGAWGTVQVDCPTGDRVCIVTGAVLYSLPDDSQAINMFDLMSHEFGHCLGLGHVGDASDFAAKSYPADDIMSYEQDDHDPGVALCVSNLDLKTFAFRYKPLITGSGDLGYGDDADGYVVMAGGADPVGGATVLSPLPASSWRVFRADGSESPFAADCPQPDLALVQTPPEASGLRDERHNEP